MHKNLVIKDNLPSMPIINEEGHLYKKQNETGLFWTIQDKEKDLTKIDYPLCADDGNKDEPSYNFKNSQNTGLYKIPLGGIGISVDGENVISIEKNKTCINSADINSIKTKDLTVDTININNTIINSNTLESICNPLLKFSAISAIEKGDLVCIDNNEKAIKALGGKWINLTNNISGLLKYADNDKLITINNTDNNNSAEINIYKFKYDNSLYQIELLDTITFNCNNITDLKIIKINNFHIAAWPDSNIIKIIKLEDKQLFNININNVCDKFNIIEENNNIVIAVYCSNISNITLVILDNNINLINTVLSISQEPIIDTLDKTINIISTPGNVIIISFGNRKLAVVLSNINNIITGEILIDYESYDCVDMHYNINNGIIISLEKTNANTCFIEVLDILGTKIQKITSKKFGNITMIPHNLVYNNNTDNYLLFFNNKVQIIKYNGDSLDIGMQYGFDSILENNISRLFYVNNNLFICHVGKLLCYMDGYQGNPSAYIGISNNKCDINDICNITIKGNIFESNVNLPNNYVGSKLYLYNVNSIFPQNLSTVKTNIFVGTCISKNKILIGI